jgi:hypothetical protein
MAMSIAIADGDRVGVFGEIDLPIVVVTADQVT